MHEVSIALALIELCEARRRDCGAKRVTIVGVRIGPLAGVDPEALRFAFDALTPDTPLSGARLEIEFGSRYGCRCPPDTPLIASSPHTCPRCGAPETLADAQALDLQYLDVEELAT